MEKFKKIVVILFTVVLLVNSNYTYAENKEPSEEVIKNQKESLQAYQTLYKEMNNMIKH